MIEKDGCSNLPRFCQASQAAKDNNTKNTNSGTEKPKTYGLRRRKLGHLLLTRRIFESLSISLAASLRRRLDLLRDSRSRSLEPDLLLHRDSPALSDRIKDAGATGRYGCAL